MELMEIAGAAAAPQRDAFYAGTVAPEVGVLLEQAMSVYSDTVKAESLLLQARQQAPESLPVYFSLYKFYFYKGQLKEAEETVRSALATAARLAGISENYAELSVDSADWSRHDSPQHFYLFSLKALSFIRLRQGDIEECERILGKLTELDGGDTVGGSVIRAFADGL